MADQAVTNAANPDATQSGGAEGAQDVAALVREFDSATTPKPAAQPVVQGDIRELADYVRRQRQQEADREFRADLEGAVKATREGLDLPPIFKDRYIRGALNDYASEDPTFAQAWIERRSKPQAWDAALKRFRKTVEDDLKEQPDANATRQHDRIASAVKSASTAGTAGGDEDLSTLTDAQLDAKKREWLRAAKKR